MSDATERDRIMARFAADTLLNAVEFYCESNEIRTRAAFARALRSRLTDAEYTVIMDALMTVDVMRTSHKGVKE